MTPHDSPEPSAAGARRSLRRPVVVATLAFVLVAALLLAAAAGTLWWAVRTESGTARLLAWLPGLEVESPSGALLGDFKAQRVVVHLPGAEGDHIEIAGLVWRGLRIERASGSAWARIVIDELRASRIDVKTTPDPQAKPLQAPADLHLPVELDIAALQAGDVFIGALGAKPLHDLRARLQLGASAGALHRIDGLHVEWDRLQLGGSAQIASRAPFQLDVGVKAQQRAAAAAPAAAAASGAAFALPAWDAQATLTGPLNEPALHATLHAAAQPGREAQSLDAQATLHPFAPWPLGELRASMRALDLAAFASAAPATALSGDATATSQGLDKPAQVTATLTNPLAGRWNEGRLPVRRLALELGAVPSDPDTLELKRFDADLGGQTQAAGRMSGHGRWTQQRWTLELALDAVQPSLLDARAPAMRLGGPLHLAGGGIGSAGGPTVDVQADLRGQLTEPNPSRPVALKLDASGSAARIELRSVEASAGGPRATASGIAEHAAPDAPWTLRARSSLVDFDPAVWWPGDAGSPWRRAANRLNAQADVELQLSTTPMPEQAMQWLAAVRGNAELTIADSSLLAGVPLGGTFHASNRDGTQWNTRLALHAAGNTLDADGHAATHGSGSADAWTLKLDAAALDRLAPLWALLRPAVADASLAGRVTASGQLTGRWPSISAQGQLQGDAIRVGSTRIAHASGRWQAGSSGDAPLDVQLGLEQLALAGTGANPGPSIESAQLQVKGTARAHTLELRAESKALPPAWTDTLQRPARAPAAAGSASAPSAGTATTAVAAAPSAGASAAARTVALLQAHGGLVDDVAGVGPADARAASRTASGSSGRTDGRAATTPAGTGSRPAAGARSSTGASAGAPTGWRGSFDRVELSSAGQAPWLRTETVAFEAAWSGGPPRALMQPGRADILGGSLRWSRIAWQAAASEGAPAQIDAQAELEPLRIAPLLARAQPDFGWGGDLTIGGTLNIHSAPSFHADIVIERRSGDLSVTEELGTEALGLTDLRLALNASDGVWNFTQALAGKTLGVAAGAIVARTSPQATWPSADTPIEGVLELRVANLGTWGPWVPPGWRLDGALHTSASIGGRFGAPEYTGELDGSKIAVRNFLQGVNISDGEVSIRLQGARAHIESFTAKAGNGTLTLEGDAELGSSPVANLKLAADKFQVLGRVDRRIVASGRANLRLDSKSVALDGRFDVDEGLIDFTRSDAPSLASDVEVIRSNRVPSPAQAASAAASPAARPVVAAPTTRDVALDLRVGLGEKLRVRGHGLDAGLRGELHITSPGGRLAVDGTVRAVDGTYAAYGQKLVIDRGLVTFSGSVENPRLDIEATRPNLDVRVGVAITGTPVNPRVRLFSEPELSEIDKLSWLVMGRASDGLGRTDTALLQRAALALLSGEGSSPADDLTKAIGLDEISVRQSDGDVRETVVALGKQLSRRWYVGYERGLNATAGNWQLIYRIAQRFTLRAQSGLDNSLDLIWTWRWQ